MRFVDGWYIPALDPTIRSQKNPIRQQMANDIGVIDRALKYVSGRECVIQAGARVGLWPFVLAQSFRRVVAFEPETRNYECAVLNLEKSTNVELHRAALGAKQERLWVEFSRDTSGSHQIVSSAADEECDVFTIDSLLISPDAIFLDIEGYELAALKGSQKTLERSHPVLVLEENSAKDRYGIKPGDLSRWLTKFGYRVVDRHYKDLIFAAK